MGRMIDLTGQRFGRLTVVEMVGKDNCKKTLWKCKCDCGNEVTVRATNLKQGCTTSCGCFRKEIVLKNTKKRNQFLRKDGTMICSLTAKKSKNNTSGVKGVSWNTKKQKWRAEIGFKKQKIYLGLFSTLEAAAKARALAEEEYFQPILDKYSTHFKCDLLEAVK